MSGVVVSFKRIREGAYRSIDYTIEWENGLKSKVSHDDIVRHRSV
jgi:hypothetical protein